MNAYPMQIHGSYHLEAGTEDGRNYSDLREGQSARSSPINGSDKDDANSNKGST
jgi:hypothetical protein